MTAQLAGESHTPRLAAAALDTPAATRLAVAPRASCDWRR